MLIISRSSVSDCSKPHGNYSFRTPEDAIQAARELVRTDFVEEWITDPSIIRLVTQLTRRLNSIFRRFENYNFHAVLNSPTELAIL